MFTFVIEGCDFPVHSALVTMHSEPLDRMINGTMKEAQGGRGCLEEVDKTTFSQVCRWLYSGDYSDLAPPPREKSAVVPGTETASASDSDAAHESEPESLSGSEDTDLGQPQRKRRKGSVVDEGFAAPGMVPTRNCLKTRQRAFLRLVSLPHYSTSVSTSVYHGEDGAEALLHHARVYVFAEMYNIRKLRNLALFKLHLKLVNFGDGEITPIVPLVDYIYQNTMPRENPILDLRTWILEYVACRMEDFASSSDFSDLLSQDSGVLRDFQALVVRTLEPVRKRKRAHSPEIRKRRGARKILHRYQSGEEV